MNKHTGIKENSVNIKGRRQGLGSCLRNFVQNYKSQQGLRV